MVGRSLADSCPVILASTLLPAAADEVGDPAASRTVYVVVVVLAVIGVALIAVTVWLVRSTRPDLALLAPLERMATRRWSRLDPQARRRLLDEVRPEGADPLDRAPDEPEVDREFAAIRPPVGFADLEDRPSAGAPVDPLVLDTELVDPDEADADESGESEPT